MIIFLERNLVDDPSKKEGSVSLHKKYFSFSEINIDKFCEDKELETCVIRLDFLAFKICIITIYRSSTGTFQSFIKRSGNIINKIYKSGVHLIICGDINTTYLTESKEKHELNNILHSYNLISVINFPTRIKNNSSTAIDNIFIDITQFGMYSTYPMKNGLSDHDAQVLELYVDNLNNNKNEHTTITLRKINFNTINEFKDKLSSEPWQFFLK